MGSSGGGSGASIKLQQQQLEQSKSQAEASKASALIAEQTVTPAVGRSIAADTETAQSDQADARSRLRGIRSTYSRFSQAGGSSGNGTRDRLG